MFCKLTQWKSKNLFIQENRVPLYHSLVLDELGLEPFAKREWCSELVASEGSCPMPLPTPTSHNCYNKFRAIHSNWSSKDVIYNWLTRRASIFLHERLKTSLIYHPGRKQNLLKQLDSSVPFCCHWFIHPLSTVVSLILTFTCQTSLN